ncbi:MAG: hypothetical protein ABR936_16540 [Bacteroidota bacterium]|jgi:hypothetical protein
MDISILSLLRLSPDIDALLTQSPNTSDWKTFVNYSDKLSFRYPPQYKVQKSKYSTIDKPAFEIGSLLFSKKRGVNISEFKITAVISFNSGSFEKEVGDQYVKHDGVWWSQEGEPSLVTFIKGKRLNGIYCDRGVRVPLSEVSITESSYIDYFLWIQYDDNNAATIYRHGDDFPETWLIKIAQSIKKIK